MDAPIVGVLAGIGSWIGAFFGAYLKKKGENRAIREDLDKLVDQVRVVTQTTKEIEAKISSDVWNSQKRWEMKREVLFDAAKKIVELDNGLVTLNTLLQMDDPEGAQWLEARHKATFEWNEATKRFDETQILVAITCGEDTDLALSSLSLFVRELAGKIVHKDAKIYERSSTELAKRLLAARRAIRKELGIDGTVPQAS